MQCLYLRGGSDDGGSVGGRREGAPATDKARHDWAGFADDPEAMERGLRGVINPKEGDDYDRSCPRINDRIPTLDIMMPRPQQ